jgi:hypothetical protein
MFCFTAIVSHINCSLTSAKSDLWVDSCIHAYGGISLLTNHVATQSEISLIGSTVTAGLAPLKPAEASLPTLRSYLKIIDVPYFRGSVPITPDQICDVMGQSHMVSSFILTNTPHVMQNLRKSDTATMWFDIADSQSGASAKRLIGTTLQIRPMSCYVRAACAHPGTPLCQHYWCWGHSTKACCVQAPRCL